MLDNSKEAFFSQDALLSQYYSNLELIQAFKIENGVLLKEFESRLVKAKDSFLKGLFVPISKKQISMISLFGFQKVKSIKEYRHKFLRIPQPFLKNN